MADSNAVAGKWERAWIITVLGCIVFFGAAALVVVLARPEAAASAVSLFGLVAVALLLAPVLHRISALSVGGELGLKAEIAKVEAVAERARTTAEAASADVAEVRRRLSNELAPDYDRSLREERVAAHRELWGHLKPLALYFPSAPVTYATLADVGQRLMGWYFDYGMFLTDAGRDRYFFLQDVLQVLVKSAPDRNEPLTGTLPSTYAEAEELDRKLEPLFKTTAGAGAARDVGADTSVAAGAGATTAGDGQSQLCKHFTPRAMADAEVARAIRDARELHFALVRCAASALRTQTVEDVHTRAKSLVDAQLVRPG